MNTPADLRVSEVFYSLQGEGGRAGVPSLFVRLSGCSAKHACAASGVVCDTEFESGSVVTVHQLQDLMVKAIEKVTKHGTEDRLPDVVWTGGEPLDQLTAEHIRWLRQHGWSYHAIETSGVKPISDDLRIELNYIVISPKVAEHVLAKNFPWALPHTSHFVDELRYVRHTGQPDVPAPALRASRYVLSPHSDGHTVNDDNVRHCVQLCLRNPKWALSVQQHKIWKVL